MSIRETEDLRRWATVRPAVTADAVAIVNVHFAAVHRTAATFYSPEVLDLWSTRPDDARYQQMREVIAGGDEFILVAETAAGVVAFGSIVPQLRELRAVYVHPDAGRRGIGSQVLGELERLALESGVSQLHVDASINSEAFYQRAGYEVVGRGLHGFRTGHEMACVKMVKNLQH
jgi:L-amino acid N-acyltransferase YncA